MCAADVEVVDWDRVVFLVSGFFARIELATPVDVFSACCAFLGNGAINRTGWTFGPACYGARDLTILEGPNRVGSIWRAISFKHGERWSE